MAMDDSLTFTVDVWSPYIQNSKGTSYEPTGANLNTSITEAIAYQIEPCPKDGLMHPWVHIPSCTMQLELIQMPAPFQSNASIKPPCSNMHIFGNGMTQTNLWTDQNTSPWGGGVVPIWIVDAPTMVTGVELENFSLDMNLKGSNAIICYGDYTKCHHIHVNRAGVQAWFCGRSTAAGYHTNVGHWFHDLYASNSNSVLNYEHAFALGRPDGGTYTNLWADNHWSGLDCYPRNSTFSDIHINNYGVLGMKVIDDEAGWTPQNSTFNNITITRDAQVPGWGDSLKIYNNTDCHYTNLYLTKGLNGVTAMYNDYNVSFDNVEIHDTANMGFSMAGAGDNITLNDIRVYNAGSYGFNLQTTNNVTLTGLLLDGANGYNPVRNCSNFHMSNSTIQNNGGTALSIGGTTGLVLDSVTIQNNASVGVDMRASTANTSYTIQNCLIKNNTYPIITFSGDDYLTIINNTICLNNPNSILDNTTWSNDCEGSCLPNPSYHKCICGNVYTCP